MRRIRFITAEKSCVVSVESATPNRDASSASIRAREARISAFEGTHPTLRQSPPIKLRSMRATRAPRPAAIAAVTKPAVPAPITTRL